MRMPLLILALLVTGSAVAQTRPSTLAMTCGQNRQLVAAKGAIVLATGATTYDLYVADARNCLPGQATKRSLVPARDTPYCPLQVCYDPTGDRWIND